MQLPEDFIRSTREVMGEERFGRYLKAFEEEAPVSIRLNPRKAGGLVAEGGEQVPWCAEGFYLPRRPNFTFDPLLHAGCYYVQEASSMFISHVLRQYVTTAVTMLDLCAAPGGKSTAAIAVLPEGSRLYSNEPLRQRASVLAENVAKWGYPNCIVTNNYPHDYRAAKMRFDVILCDVPCSGEGMFRRSAQRDAGADIGEWSLQAVEKCWRLQRDIVADAWACLNDGGLLIYSTCTFNTKENEENVRWMLTEFDDAQVLPVATQPEWNITGSLLEGFDQPVYRFIPGISRGEGLFVCALRKGSVSHKIHKTHRPHISLRTLPIPPQADAPSVALSYAQAMAYLRGEALTLPADAPRGIVEVCFDGHPLGTVKNIGTRANNLYPKEWRIKTTHIPTDYEAILRPA